MHSIKAKPEIAELEELVDSTKVLHSASSLLPTYTPKSSSSSNRRRVGVARYRNDYFYEPPPPASDLVIPLGALLEFLVESPLDSPLEPPNLLIPSELGPIGSVNMAPVAPGSSFFDPVNIAGPIYGDPGDRGGGINVAPFSEPPLYLSGPTDMISFGEITLMILIFGGTVVVVLVRGLQNGMCFPAKLRAMLKTKVSVEVLRRWKILILGGPETLWRFSKFIGLA